jgi:exopolysaccharide biosynthesis operon protein EpsL
MHAHSSLMRSRGSLALAISACLVAIPAFAGESDPLKLILSETLTHDDNVFRRARSAAPVADSYSSSSVGLMFDTDLSRQHIHGEASKNNTRFNQLKLLDNEGSNVQFGWQGSFPGRLKLDAHLGRSESLANYEDIRTSTAKDIVTNESASLRLSYALHPDWSISAQMSNGKTTNSAVTSASNDTKTKTAELSLQYDSPLGNQAMLLLRTTDGRYPNRQVVASGLVDNSYRQNELQALVRWAPSAKSAFNVRIGRTRREQEQLPQRNFTGATGSLSFDWAATSKTSFNVTAGRDVSPQDFGLAKYAIVRSYGIGAGWLPTAKISTRLQLNYQSRIYGGDVGLASGAAPIPTDATRSASLSLHYTPIRALNLSMQYSHEVRESNNPALPFSSNIATLSGTLTF